MRKLSGLVALGMMVGLAVAQTPVAKPQSVKVGFTVTSNRERIQQMLPALQQRLQKEMSGKSGFTLVAAETCSDCKYILTIDVTQHNMIEASVGNKQTSDVGERQPVDDAGALYIKYRVEEASTDKVLFNDSMSLPPGSERLGPDFQQLDSIVRDQVSAAANQALKKLKKKEKA
jgi:hypothetical protein